MASESKSEVNLLEADEECYYCFVPLHKGTIHYREFVNELGERVYECDRCSAINLIEREEMKRIIELSKKDMDKGITAFEMDHIDMMAMSEMDSSLNGMADFEGWMTAASEVLRESEGAVSSGCGEVKTLNILPDKAMAEKIKKIQEESIAEMDLAKTDWLQKADHFLSPSDMEFIHGDGVHGPDSLSYQDWRSTSVRIPIPKDGISADSELGSLRSKWLNPVQVGSYRTEGGAAPPQVEAVGGAGRSTNDEELKMTERQMWLLGLMDN